MAENEKKEEKGKGPLEPISFKRRPREDELSEEAAAEETAEGEQAAEEPLAEEENSEQEEALADEPEAEEGSEEEEALDEYAEEEDLEEYPEDEPEEDIDEQLEEERRLREEEEKERRALEQLEKERLKQEEKQRKQEEKERKRAEKEKKKAEKAKLRQTPEYKRRMRVIRIVLGAVILAVLICLSIFLIKRYAKFSGYNITANIEMTNVDENTQVYRFHNGYIKCGGDGVTYFDKNGIIWSEGLAMANPICDVNGEYIAVCDMKSTEVYIYGTSGFINKISLLRVATDVEVSKFGSIAVLTNEDDANYIEIKDKEGNDVINVKTVFSSTGYPMDIALSSDGTRLAAGFVSVADSNIGSKVIFYDFSGSTGQDEDAIAGEFTQYEDTILTNVEFVNDNRVVAIGDNAFSIYSFTGKPEIVYENLELPWQIESYFRDDNHIGFIVANTESDNAYAIKAYNLNGQEVCDEQFDFAYNHVTFAGSNVVLYKEYDCDVINFAGTHKFSGTFDNRIYYLMPIDDGVNYILLSSGHTQFIKLR